MNTKRLTGILLSALVCLLSGQAWGEAPFSTSISVSPSSSAASLVTNLDSTCKQENALVGGSCTKSPFLPSVQVIGDAASCIQFSGAGVDTVDWNVRYEINLPVPSTISYSRYNFFTFNQSCTSGSGIDVDVLTSDGIWESARTNSNSPGYSNPNNYWPWSTLYLSDYGPQILSMSCLAPTKADCSGYYDKLKAIKVCWSPATADCKAATVGSSVSSALSAQSLTGLWYDQTYTGSGFNIVMSSVGLLVTYYGWDSNHNRLWLSGDIGPTQITTGTAITLGMNQTAGGSFLSPAPPGTNSKWGTLTLNFSSCKAATATLSGKDGTVNQNLTQIVGLMGVSGC